jgi:DNA repair exonuclease SbcCD ATPase subunit
MKIESLSATGLKSGDFQHKLAPVNLIVGDNFSGKTARLEAVRLVLLGYLPELGKTNQATMELARNGSLAVSATFDNGQSWARTWKRGRKSIETTTTAPENAIPDVLMDPGVYFGLGDKDRVRYVFSHADVELGGGTERALADSIITNLKRIKLPDHTEHHERAINALVEFVDQSDRDRHDADQAVQEWIEQLIVEVRDRLKLAKQNADRMAKTVQGLVAIKATEDESAIANVQGEIDGLRKLLFSLGTERAHLVERFEQAKANDKARADLVNLLNRSVDNGPLIERLDGDLGAIGDKMAAPAPQQPSIEAKEAALAALQQEIDAYGSATEEISGRLFEARRNRDLQAAQREALEKAIQERAAKNTADMALECCPFCRSKAKGWKKSIETEFQTWLKAKREELEFLTDEAKGFEKIVTNLEADLEHCRKLDEQNNQRRIHSSNLTLEIRKLRNQVDEARKRLAAEAIELRARVQSLRESQKAVEEAKAKLATMPEPLTIPEATAFVAKRGDLDSRIAETEQKIKGLEDRQRTYHAAKQDEKRNAQALLQYEDTTSEVEVTKQAVSMFEALQEKMVERAFGSILERANLITEGILPTRLQFRDGDVGMLREGTWVSHRTFSGMEKALAYAGISAALAHRSPIKIVMIDELGRMTGRYQRLLLERMLQLYEAGKIDQFIGVSPAAQEDLPESVNVLSM